MPAANRTISTNDLPLKRCELIVKLSIYLHSKDIIRTAQDRDKRENVQRIIDGHVNRWMYKPENQKKILSLIFQDFDLDKLTNL